MEQYSRCVREIVEKEKWPGSNKKVFYADFLQFLLKITDKGETESSICGEGKNEATETKEEEETETVIQQMGTLQHRRRKTTKASDEIDRKILKLLKKNRT